MLPNQLIDSAKQVLMLPTHRAFEIIWQESHHISYSFVNFKTKFCYLYTCSGDVCEIPSQRSKWQSGCWLGGKEMDRSIKSSVVMSFEYPSLAAHPGALWCTGCRVWTHSLCRAVSQDTLFLYASMYCWCAILLSDTGGRCTANICSPNISKIAEKDGYLQGCGIGTQSI